MEDANVHLMDTMMISLAKILFAKSVILIVWHARDRKSTIALPAKLENKEIREGSVYVKMDTYKISMEIASAHHLVN